MCSTATSIPTPSEVGYLKKISDSVEKRGICSADTPEECEKKVVLVKKSHTTSETKNCPK